MGVSHQIPANCLDNSDYTYESFYYSHTLSKDSINHANSGDTFLIFFWDQVSDILAFDPRAVPVFQ